MCVDIPQSTIIVYFLPCNSSLDTIAAPSQIKGICVTNVHVYEYIIIYLCMLIAYVGIIAWQQCAKVNQVDAKSALNFFLI